MIQCCGTAYNAFESIKGSAPAMMLRLAPDVIHDKRQILLAEGYGPVSALPGERDSASQSAIQIMSTRTLQLSDPVADSQARTNPDGRVDVVLDSSDLVDERSRCLSHASPQESMNALFGGSS